MKKIEPRVSAMQEEVWRMKENIYEDTKHLSASAFFHYIKNKCKKIKFVNKSFAAL